jgi:hypothetical protein
MTRRLSFIGLALILGLSLSASARAVELAELDLGTLLQTSTPTMCTENAPASVAAEGRPAPLFLMASEEEASYCWCCAKTGHPDCCNPCFQTEPE